MRGVVRLENPLSEDQSVMRPTLLGSMLDIAAHNHARGAADIAIFESGTVYRTGEGPLADEHHALGGLLHGSLGARSWRGDSAPAVDFFVVKGIVEALLDALRVEWAVGWDEWPFLHPGRSASVLVDERSIGFAGELHPLVADAWGLERTAVFALDLGRLAAAAPPVLGYRDVTSFPPALEDIAVVVDADVPAARVIDVVTAAGAPTLARVGVFDRYEGPQVGEGRVSLALHLEHRAPDRTLTSEEVAERRAAIESALATELGGELRA
jgi:phenylalanyl-tRNA synthetase beta chain